MLTLEQIEAVILKLPPDEFQKLLKWFFDLDDQRWDEQLEKDIADGKLESLAQEAIADFKAGHYSLILGVELGSQCRSATIKTLLGKASGTTVKSGGRIVSTTYTTDFDLWIQRTAQLLRERRWHEIDLEHLIEEIENLGKSERRGIASQLTRLLLHLLKWQYQPQRRSDSWLDSITDSRTQIELAIKDSPRLRGYTVEQVKQSYQQARSKAAKQTGISLLVFPEESPYLLQLVLEEDWLPEESA